MKIVKTFSLCVVTLLCGCLGAMPASAEDWDWSVVPYAWGSAIGADVFVDDDEVIDADLGFDDILDKTDFVLQMHVEAQRGKSGVFVDVTYLNTGSTQTTGANPPLPGGTQIKSDVRTTLFEAGGFYRLSGDTHGLDLIFGARVIDLDVTLEFDLPPPLTGTRELSGGDTFTDGFAGLRYSMPFAERWVFSARGDVGAGDSDLAMNASAYFGYAVGKQPENLILFGYRHLEVEFKDSSDGESVETDMSMSGPAIGFSFRF